MTDSSSEAERLRRIAEDQPPFGKLLGVRILVAEADRLEAEMPAKERFGNRNGVMHGGAIVGLADNIGGTASFLNLKPGETTSTVESKINFLRAIPVGGVVRVVCEAVHRGRRTLVWQIRILREDGKLAAIVTQTQMVMPAE